MRQHLPLITRAFAYAMLCGVFLYLLNNYLVYWQDLPGTYALAQHYGWFGLEPEPIAENKVGQA